MVQAVKPSLICWDMLPSLLLAVSWGQKGRWGKGLSFGALLCQSTGEAGCLFPFRMQLTQ